MLTRTRRTRKQYDALIAAVTSSAPIDVRVEVEIAPAALELTEDAVAAIVAAAAEALRNVQNHSGADQATLRVRAHDGGVVVEVSDDGRGLEGTEPGFGLRHSIIDRMHDVGGAADVRSDAAGTTVRLTWVPPRPPGAERLDDTWQQTMADATDARTLLRMAAPLLVAMLWIAMRHSGTEWQGTALRGLAAGLAGSFLLTLALLTKGPPRWWHLTLWSLLAAGSVIVGDWLTAGQAERGFGLWYAAFAVLPLVFLGYFAPTRALPLLVLPTLFALCLDVARAAWTDPWASATAFNTLVPVVLASLMGSSLRSARLSQIAQQRRLLEAENASTDRAFLHAARNRRLRHTIDTVLPFLESVAGGSVAVDDPGVRRRAQLLGHEARDELYVPEFFDDSLRAAVSQFRSKGGNLTLRAGLTPGPGHRPSHEVIAFLVENLRPLGTRITVSDRTGRETLIRVVPGLDPAQSEQLVMRLRWGRRADAAEERIAGDEFSTSITVPNDIPIQGGVLGTDINARTNS